MQATFSAGKFMFDSQNMRVDSNSGSFTEVVLQGRKTWMAPRDKDREEREVWKEKFAIG